MNGTFYSFDETWDGAKWIATLYIPFSNDEDVHLDMRAFESENMCSLDLEKISEANITEENIARNYVFRGVERLNDADVTDLNELQIPMTRDSVILDLKNEMISKHGNPYVDKVVYTATDYPGVNKIQIREELFYRVTKTNSLGFAAGTTLSAIATATGSTKLSVLSLVLGVAGDTIDTYKSVDVYNAYAAVCRYGTVNGGTYAYTTIFRFVDYVGVNERNNDVRAYLTTNGVTSYTPSSSYFVNYRAQCDDTYAAYS